MSKESPRGSEALESVRLDVWLSVACVFPTRSQAKAACEGGRVDVNGSRARAHREIRSGDRLSVSRSERNRRELVVLGLADHSIARAEARKLYEDVTPPVPPEVAEVRRLDRMLAPRSDPRRPDRRERRERIRWKGR
jgi:ribosome-associated heat shock protein Hsp15